MAVDVLLFSLDYGLRKLQAYIFGGLLKNRSILNFADWQVVGQFL